MQLCSKALWAPSLGGGCVIPITVPYYALLVCSWYFRTLADNHPPVVCELFWSHCKRFPIIHYTWSLQGKTTTISCFSLLHRRIAVFDSSMETSKAMEVILFISTWNARRVTVSCCSEITWAAEQSTTRYLLCYSQLPMILSWQPGAVCWDLVGAFFNPRMRCAKVSWSFCQKKHTK